MKSKFFLLANLWCYFQASENFKTKILR
jgi:hypothetical protein